MRGADCSTDHFLVRTICKFHVEPIRERTKASVPKRVNVRSLVDDYEVQTKFQEALASKLNSLDQSSETSINEQWQSLSAATHEVMLENLELHHVAMLTGLTKTMNPFNVFSTKEQLQGMKCSTQVSAPKLQNLRNVREKFNLLLGR